MSATCQIQANYQQAKKMLQADPVAQQVITGRFKNGLETVFIRFKGYKNGLFPEFVRERHLVAHYQNLLIKSAIISFFDGRNSRTFIL